MKVGRVCFDHVKRVGGLSKFSKSVFNGHRARRRLIEVRRVRFDRRPARRRLGEVWRIRLDHRQACRKLEDRRVSFDHRQASI